MLCVGYDSVQLDEVSRKRNFLIELGTLLSPTQSVGDNNVPIEE